MNILLKLVITITEFLNVIFIDGIFATSKDHIQ
jgi:hypothetical protein